MNTLNICFFFKSLSLFLKSAKRFFFLERQKKKRNIYLEIMDAKEDAAEDEASVTRLRTKDDSSGGGFCDDEEEEKERRRRVVGSSSSKQKGDVNDAINVDDLVLARGCRLYRRKGTAR